MLSPIGEKRTRVRSKWLTAPLCLSSKLPIGEAGAVIRGGRWECGVSYHGNCLLANHREQEEVFWKKPNRTRKAGQRATNRNRK